MRRLAIAIAAAMVIPMTALAACDAVDWSHPGENKFVGHKLRAVDKYTDIPPDIRDRLKDKIKAKQPDDIAEIQRDTIIGRHSIYTGLRDMWFGASTRCRTVTRLAWSTGRIERALVYTVGDHSIIIPDVCGNVARVDWAPLNGKKQTEVIGKPAAKSVPEPSALMLAIAAMGALAIRRKGVAK